MRINIVTIYQPFTNLGSFLQAYALKIALNEMGHKVSFVKIDSHFFQALRMVTKINPKREFFLRASKAFYAITDLSKLDYNSVEQTNKSADLVIFGSDEIWNIVNPYFRHPTFWGLPFRHIPMIGYAVSSGHAQYDDFKKYSYLTSNIVDFTEILSRDKHTRDLIKETLGINSELVVDPTLLIDVSKLSAPIKLPAQKYLLVYTYGLNSHMISVVKQFAKKHNLIIVSPCFWHIWADRVIECSALQFSALIKGAEYVFTTTFHGAIFSLINHSRCCILPVREKVRAVCETLQCADRLISDNDCFDVFDNKINIPLDVETFENNLSALRADSLKKLTNAIQISQK